MTVHKLPAFFLAFGLLLASPLPAQTTDSTPGRITGRVVDASTGEGIPGALVTIEGGVTTVRTDMSGHYVLAKVSPGPRTVAVRMIGYAPKSVTGVIVNAGAATILNVTLSVAAVTVAGVEVTAEAERGSVNRALDEQRTANQIVNTITAEQIRRSPDSDAGQAVQRVSGVTVQDGKYVFVRGLGERYTTTALNGTRLPSAEPERKVVPLDLFPSGLLEGITTYKTFTPDQPGDFSGAQVNLKTRDYLPQRLFVFSSSASYNEAFTGARALRAPTTGTEWLGIGGSRRDLPAIAQNAGNLQGLTQNQLNAIASSFRNAWTSQQSEVPANGSFSLSLGGQPALFGRQLEALGSLSYSYGYEGRYDEQRSLIRREGGTFIPSDTYHGATGRTTALWGGLFNISTRIGDAGRLAFNNTYTHSGDNEATRLAGFNEDIPDNIDVTRLTFTERIINSHQLSGQHLVAGRHTLDWSTTYSHVKRTEPDRTDLIYQTTIDAAGNSQPYAWLGGGRSATKTFSDVEESGYEASLNYRHVLGSPATPTAFKLGLYGKITDRDADTRAYDLQNLGLTPADRAQPAEVIFDGTYASQGRLFLSANAALGRYRAADRLVAGYGQVELTLSRRWRMIGGARVEASRLEITNPTTMGTQETTVLDYVDALPSLAVQYKLGERQNVRLSASQTLSRPEYRELSPLPYIDILGGQNMSGYPGLKRALVQNFDLRWEWYPGTGQVLSAALFAKRFDHPIERILVQNADGHAPAATFRNAEAAHNYGIELELRRNLAFLASPLLPVTVFTNVTLIRSEIRPSTDSLSSLTSASRPMVGQAEYVVNAGLNYTGASNGLSATVLYNVVGTRLHEAAIFPLPDVYEHPRQVLDVSLHWTLLRGATLKFEGKNLLDSPYQLTQGPVERLSYRTGRVFSVGVSWEP